MPCDEHSVSPDGITYSIPSYDQIVADFRHIRQRAEAYRTAGKKVVVVQGLGFVGSAVAAAIASARDPNGQPSHFVIGVDLDLPQTYWKVAKVALGQCPIVSPDNSLDILMRQAVLETRNLAATVSEEAYALADVIVVDVPLSVGERTVRTPGDISIDLRNFTEAIRTIGRRMAPDALVLIETTVPAGTTQRIVQPVLEEERRRRHISAHLNLAHAYERVMPGPKYVDSIKNFPRTFSGIDQESASRAREFLSSFINVEQFPLWELSDTTGSELAKLLENSYRAANIALIHEWSLLAEKLEVNLFEIVDSIRVRKGTHDNMRYPGFGVGGYCLTKDSLLAQWAALRLFNCDVTLGMTLAALRTNYLMPMHTLELLQAMFPEGVREKTVAVCGLAYLPGVADTRNTPTELLVSKLLNEGAQVVVHDPCIRTWPEMPTIPLQNDLGPCLRSADAVIFAVPHTEYRGLSVDQLVAWCAHRPVIVDSQNTLSDLAAQHLHDNGCCLMGVGKGHWRKKGFQCRKVTSVASSSRVA